MIGYRTSRAALERLIEAQSPGWLTRASSRTEGFRSKKRYEEASSIWSEVKAVYMGLQGSSKCSYCERKLESVEFGKVEQDVEHFRPKGGVRAWKVPQSLAKHGIRFTAAPKAGKGYYLLPYHPFNYSATCKPCNSVLKKDWFPIAGRYDLDGADPVALAAEKPLLICPIGDFDADPETLIGFHGVSPQPVVAAGHDRHRALVTIEFFKLDDIDSRKNLVRERAAIIVAMHPQLEKLADTAISASARRTAQALIDGFTAPNSSHTSCARSFRALFQRDRAEATAVFDRAVTLITSIS